MPLIVNSFAESGGSESETTWIKCRFYRLIANDESQTASMPREHCFKITSEFILYAKMLRCVATPVRPGAVH